MALLHIRTKRAGNGRACTDMTHYIEFFALYSGEDSLDTPKYYTNSKSGFLILRCLHFARFNDIGTLRPNERSRKRLDLAS